MPQPNTTKWLQQDGAMADRLVELWRKYVPNEVRRNLGDIVDAPSPIGWEDDLLKSAFAMPALLANPRYLKMLEQYAGSSKKIINPIIEKAMAKFGRNAAHYNPEAWLHGSPQEIEKFQHVGMAGGSADPNTALGAHFGSVLEQSKNFLRGKQPTLHVVNLKADNPAYFPSELELQKILHDQMNTQRAAGGKRLEDITQEAGIDLMDRLLQKGHDAILYGNMFEGGNKGAPSAISFFPSKQIDIIGKSGLSKYGQLTNYDLSWLQDQMPADKLLDVVARKGLQNQVFGSTVPTQGWWR